MPSILRIALILMLSWVGLVQAQTMSVTTRTSGVLFDSFMPALFADATLADGAAYTLNVTSTFSVPASLPSGYLDTEIEGAAIDVTFGVGGKSYHFSGTGLLSLFYLPGQNWSPKDFFSGAAVLPMPGLENSTLSFTHGFRLPSIYYPAAGGLDPVTLNNPFTIEREIGIFMRDSDGLLTGRISGVPTSLYYEITAPAPAQVTSPVPEPAAWMLLMLGLAVLAAPAIVRSGRLPLERRPIRRAISGTATVVLSTVCLAAAAAPVTISTTSSGILYNSTMPQVFGDTPFVDGSAYELSFQTTFDAVPFVGEQSEQIDAGSAEIVATFTHAGITHQLSGTGKTSIFFARNTGFDHNRTFISIGAWFNYEPIANTRIIFVHNFELPSAFYPAEHVLDTVDIDTRLTTQHEAVITLLTLDQGRQLGRIYGIPTSLQYTVSPVPEPATWSMLLVGAALTVAAVRRRRGAAVQG